MTAEAKIRISATDATKAAFASITGSMSNLERSAKQVQTAFNAVAGIALVRTLTSAVFSTVTLADELNKLSQRTGIAVESLSSLQQAAELADVSSEEFTAGIKKLNLALTEAKDGTSQAGQLFKALGVDTTKGAEVALRGVADALGKIPDAAVRVRIANELLGKGGEKLIPLLLSGSKGFDEIRASAERYGTVISAKLARDSEEFNDNLTKLKQSAGVLGVTLASQLLPPLLTITDNLVKAREGGRGFQQVLIEIDKLAASTLGGIENLFTGGGGRLDQMAQRTFEIAKRIEDGRGGPLREDRGRIRRPEAEPVGPQLPPGRAPDVQAILKALNPASKGGAPKKDPFIELLEKQAETRLRLQVDAAQAEQEAEKAGEAAKKNELEYLADLAIANENRIQQAQEAGDAAQKAIQAEADAIKDRIDPTRAYIRDLERIAELQKEGYLTEAEAVRATTQLAEAFKAAGDAAIKTNSAAKDIGLVFVSAFENAVAGGKGLRDILKGIESDLLKLGTRKLLTEPFLEFLSPSKGGKGGATGGGFDLGGVISSVFGSIKGLIPSFAVGTDFVPATGLAMIHKGERIVPAAQNNGAYGGMNVTVNVQARDVNSFRGSEAQIAASVAASLGRAQRRNG